MDGERYLPLVGVDGRQGELFVRALRRRVSIQVQYVTLLLVATSGLPPLLLAAQPCVRLLVRRGATLRGRAFALLLLCLHLFESIKGVHHRFHL